MSETNTGGQVWVVAPYPTDKLTTGSIQGVWLNPNQDVEWIWTHTSNGSYISGWTIKPKHRPFEEFIGNDNV